MMPVLNFGIHHQVFIPAVPPDWPGGFWWHWLFFTVVIIAFVLTMVMGAIYIERRGMGRMQSRLGPNRTGPFGLLQPVADAIKVLLKENIVPVKADKLVHWLAPVVAFAPALMLFAVIPFQDGALLADLNIGILYIVAISSVSTVGIFMAGWASSNKYSLLGAMRNVAAIVSYEMPLVLAIVGVVLIAGSLSLNRIVIAQDIPFILLQPLGFFLFFAAGCAEINRSPFDLMEADSEIVAGFHTEYSGMKFAMFYLVEYAEAIAIAAIITTLFLGGWRGPLLPPWLWFVTKVMAVFFTMVWTRTTLPRIRIDQLMALAWKFLLPLAVINLIITAIQVLASWPDTLPWTLVMIIVNFTILAVLVLLWSKFFFRLGWGRIEV
ncbi:MAG: NADH-quinone oxidoreductase subunit NuoH [Dehalococcoidales bacterium]|jgi:NADH-quinone oxidoreductase subunit H|nr:NADH-quinone oxidoreductase subunit NuoH [Dehalococcoidales bacterium]